MLSKPGRWVCTSLLAVALTPLLSAEQARGQFRARGRQLPPLRQGNASPANGLGTACQQANGSSTSTSSPTGLPQYQAGLQSALQQTNALLTALQQNGSANQNAVTALQQLQSSLQAALRQTNTLLTASQQQNGQLTSSQLQTLRQQLSALARQLRAV